MIGISGIGVHTPDGALDNLARLEEFNLAEDFIHDKSGFAKVARKDAEDETSDLCVKAVEALEARAAFGRENVDCLVVCTQNPDGFGLPHTSGVVHAKLGLPTSVAAFDVSLGCSGYVYGLSIASSFMQANGLKTGLFITADPYSKVIDETDKNTSLLFGDAAAATLLTAAPKWRLSAFAFGSDGRGANAIMVGDDRRLRMNGRAVFTFSAKVVPPFIRDLLAREALSLDDIDHFLVHQGSKFIVDTIRKELGVDEERMRFAAADLGNTVSSTIPVMLADLDAKPGDKALLCGFGVGLSWAACVATAT